MIEVRRPAHSDKDQEALALRQQAEMLLAQISGQIADIEKLINETSDPEVKARLGAARQHLANVASLLTEAINSPGNGNLATIMVQAGSTLAAAGSAMGSAVGSSGASGAQSIAQASEALGDAVDRNNKYLSDDFTDKLQFRSEEEKEEFKRKNKEAEERIAQLRAQNTPESNAEATRISIERDNAAIAHNAAQVDPDIVKHRNELVSKLNQLEASQKTKAAAPWQSTKDFNDNFRADIRLMLKEQGKTDAQIDEYVAGNPFDTARKIVHDDRLSRRLVNDEQNRDAQEIAKKIVLSVSKPTITENPERQLQPAPPIALSSNNLTTIEEVKPEATVLINAPSIARMQSRLAALTSKTPNPSVTVADKETQGSESNTPKPAITGTGSNSNTRLTIDPDQMQQRLRARGFNTASADTPDLSETTGHGLAIAKPPDKRDHSGVTTT